MELIKNFNTILLYVLAIASQNLGMYENYWRWSQKHVVRGRGKGLKKTPKTKAKHQLFEDRPFRGQGEEWTRPRAEDTIFLKFGR